MLYECCPSLCTLKFDHPCRYTPDIRSFLKSLSAEEDSVAIEMYLDLVCNITCQTESELCSTFLADFQIAAIIRFLLSQMWRLSNAYSSALVAYLKNSRSYFSRDRMYYWYVQLLPVAVFFVSGALSRDTCRNLNCRPENLDPKNLKVR